MSPEVLRKIPEHLRSATEKDLDEHDMRSERILGLHWNPKEDAFHYNLKFHKVPKEVVEGRRNPTKREILKLVMAIFDPLGFLAHYTVHVKILLQDIWRLKLDWDEQLQDETPQVTEDATSENGLNPLRRWKLWLKKLEEVKQLKIPRCYFNNNWNYEEVSLHLFSDASKKAVSAAAYLQIQDQDTTTAFVMGKSLVAPLRPLSIPKLELQVAVIATRLSQTVVQEHDIEVKNITFWTDSRIVLHWLKNDARQLEAFVGNRVGEIQEATDYNQWRWCTTKLYIADDGTRDQHKRDLSSSCR